MLRSMTGFGRGVAKSKSIAITTEIKTLNHKYLDIFIKSPKEITALEPKIKDHIKKVICRGRVEVSIEMAESGEAVSAEINHNLAKIYLSNLQKLGRELKLKDTPSLSLLCHMPGVIELHTSRISIEKVWGDVKKSLGNALAALMTMREREGKFTEKDIKKRFEIIKKKQGEIEKRLPILLSKYKGEVKKRLAELGGKADNAKLSGEISLLSEKVDISEELSRFSSHLNQLTIFLNEEGDVGKKINFTIQEMMREINTIASKANDFHVSTAAVLIKTELEKIREQVQNIE